MDLDNYVESKRFFEMHQNTVKKEQLQRTIEHEAEEHRREAARQEAERIETVTRERMWPVETIKILIMGRIQNGGFMQPSFDDSHDELKEYFPLHPYTDKNSETHELALRIEGRFHRATGEIDWPVRLGLSIRTADGINDPIETDPLISYIEPCEYFDESGIPLHNGLLNVEHKTTKHQH